MYVSTNIPLSIADCFEDLPYITQRLVLTFSFIMDFRWDGVAPRYHRQELSENDIDVKRGKLSYIEILDI